MSTAELGLSLAEMIRRDKVARHHLHRREPRGGCVQPGGARPLRARSALSPPVAAAGGSAARPASEPGDRYLHSRARGHAPHRESDARGLAGRRPRRRALFSARVHVPGDSLRQALEQPIRSTRRQLAGGGRRARSADLRARAGKTRPSATCSPRTASRATSRTSHGAHRHRIHDRVSRSGTEPPRRTPPIGFFQVGGGIAGDFPICVVPMLAQDLMMQDIPRWAYFCQISDSTTSYGSYSGAVPNEKITWGKLAADDAEVHHRIRRYDRRAADLRLRARENDHVVATDLPSPVRPDSGGRPTAELYAMGSWGDGFFFVNDAGSRRRCKRCSSRRHTIDSRDRRGAAQAQGATFPADPLPGRAARAGQAHQRGVRAGDRRSPATGTLSGHLSDQGQSAPRGRRGAARRRRRLTAWGSSAARRRS